jgi:hypothetical protein
MQDGACGAPPNHLITNPDVPNFLSRRNHMIAMLIHFCHYPLCDEPFLPNDRLDILVGGFRLNERNLLISEGTLRFLSVNA